MSSFKQQTSTTTELAKQRNRAAADRTLLAWIRNSLMLLGLGLTIDYVSVELLSEFIEVDRVKRWQMPHTLGLLTLVPGFVLLALATWQYRISVRSLGRDYGVLPDGWMVWVTATAVVLFGIICAIVVLFKTV